MKSFESALLAASCLSSAIWIGLLLWRGKFWRWDTLLDSDRELDFYPSLCAIIPARNEAEVLPKTLPALLLQDYPGELTVILVDDRSTDGTADIACEIARNLDRSIEIIAGEPLPPGWSGKLWAMAQGIRHSQSFHPAYLLLTDADICHDRLNLKQLVAKATADNLALVSLMVKLRCQSWWEKLLIPAFVFFFQKLYPFVWVNNPQNSIAAAAGGCILVKPEAIADMGGIATIRQTLIDDCALAQAIKSRHYPIWLGLTRSTSSLREYESLQSIWDMVARTAFTELKYSPLLLIATGIAMTLIYAIAPLATIAGAVTANWLLLASGLWTWILMAIAYFPAIRFYQLQWWFALNLPVIAFLYTLMTFDSALRHWQGRGGAWKGRTYQTFKQTIE